MRHICHAGEIGSKTDLITRNDSPPSDWPAIAGAATMEAGHGRADAEIRPDCAGEPGKARRRRPALRFRRDLPPLRPRAGRRPGQPLQPVRRAVLSGSLPAFQQHPRLAQAHRRRSPGGGLRGRFRHQQFPRDLRPHLPAGPALRGQLRHREGVRERHHRRGRAPHHRYRLRQWLGEADPAGPRKGRKHRHRRRRPGRPRRRRGAASPRLPGARLRPPRPRRRAADLRHPRLQAGEGDRAAPLEAAGGVAPACPASSPRSTTSPPPTAPASATRSPISPPAGSTRRARTWW